MKLAGSLVRKNDTRGGMGIAGKIIELIKEKYKNYLYIDVMPEERSNVPFYERHGFSIMEDSVAMTCINYSDKR